jgi:hypothetical protein
LADEYLVSDSTDPRMLGVRTHVLRHTPNMGVGLTWRN